MEAQALEHERRAAEARPGDPDALKHAIAAAELYMQAAAAAKTPEDRKRFRRKCADLIALGERLKAGTKPPDGPSRPPVPESTRVLTTAEKTIVLRASRLHGNVFPPWEAAPGPAVFSDAGGKGAYTDPAPLSFSPEQQAIFAGWRRPAELMSLEGGDSGGLEQLMTAQEEMDLAQDLATDCSVVASLCGAARHFGPTKDSLLGLLMYPFDSKAMRPAVSSNGKYVFRMYFNGSWRHVVVDDRLPASKTDRALYVVDRRNPRLVWPALVEKAYLKIRGGYDFPGSNSATDLQALTGWIPEQIFLQSDEIELEETWNRIKKAYDQGNAMLTLGTGNILPEEEEALGLVKEHDYAVVDLKTEDHSRLLLIKNPWVDSLVWTGVGSSATLKEHVAGSASDGASNQFWMAFEDVLQHFDSLYVNWNPALFTHRQDHHFKWDMPDATEELVFTHNPQYSVLSPSGSPVWVLLSRHWQDTELDILRQRKAEKDRGDASLATVSKHLGFMGLALYASSPPGTRVPLPDTHRCLQQGPFVDSPNTLLRYTPTAGTAQTLVVTQTELPLPTYSFTLSFFSHSPLTITPAPSPLPYNTSLTGAWTRRTAGGSAAHPTYSTNPQYCLTLAQPTPLTLVLSTSARDLPIHIAVVFSPSPSSSSSANPASKRITTLTGRDILLASAEYHLGRTSASTPLLPAGAYTLVLSTFEPGHTAPFTLLMSSSHPATLTPIPPPAAGMLRTPLPPLPAFPLPTSPSSSSSDATTPTRRLRIPLFPARLTRLAAQALPTSPPTTALRLAIERGTGPDRRVLAASAPRGEWAFADAAVGVRTGEVDVEPVSASGGREGGVWVVLERVGGEGGGENGGGGGVEVEVLSEGVVRVGGWEVGEED